MARGVKKAKAVLTQEEKLAQALVPVEEQPYPVPGNWCWVNMNQIAELFNGDRGINYPSKKDYVDTGIPFINAGAIKEGRLDCNEFNYITELKYSALRAGKIQKDDILYCLRGSLGKTAIIDFDGRGAISSSLCILRVKPTMLVKYLYYLLSSNTIERQQDGAENGSAQPNLSAASVLKYKIPFPPLAEQQRIVDRIESLFAKLDEAKEKAQAVVDGFEDRKAAILYKAFEGDLTSEWRKQSNTSRFGWKQVQIGDIADVKGGKRVPKGMALTDIDTGHPYIKAGNLKSSTVIDKDMQFVPDDVLPYIKNYTVCAGDVYITNVGACIGDCGVIPAKYDGANLTENAVKITNMNCDNFFLAWYLSSNSIQRKIRGLIASATLGKLSIANIKTIPVALPSKSEQIEIVRAINNMLSKEQAAKNVAEQALAQIDAMKKAILARAFRGELGTNDPTDESAEKLLKRLL